METRSDNSSNDKILYWRDVIASLEILEKHKVIIEKLRSGDYRAADLDLKVKSHPRVYGIKINEKERLLFTTVKIDGVSYAFILEELLDHKYENSPCMNGFVDNILESNKTQEIIAGYFAKQQEKPGVIEPKKSNNTNGKRSYKVEYDELDFIDSKWLQLDDVQRKVLSHPLPFLCNGTPGSGKSTLSLLVIAKAIDDGYQNIIYITQSLALKNEMEKNWNDSPYSKNAPPGVVVRFATYTELLKEAYPNKMLVSDKNCLEWIDKYISTHQKVYGTPEAPADFFCNESIYAEFRIACGHSESDYYKLGARQCSLSDYPEAKKLIWKMLQTYIKHLDNDNCMHAAFTSLPDLGVSMVALDEGQDFSTQQLSGICEQTKHASICIFYDSDQSLFDKISKEEYLQSCLRQRTFQHIKPLTLAYTYRNAAAIVKAGKHTLEIRIHLDGGRVNSDQKHEIKSEPTDTREGSVEWPPYYNPEGNDKRKNEIGRKLITQLKERAKSTQCAVITTKNLVAKAREIFDTESVYTVKGIKGLQYREIIIYRLYDNPKDKIYLREANDFLSKLSEDPRLNINFSKNRNNKSNTIWMNFYTAIMRAQEYVCIVEEVTRSIDSIAKFQMQKMSGEFSLKKPVEKTSTEDWEKHSIKLENIGMVEQAANIKINRIPPKPKPVITKKSTAAPKPSVIIPKPKPAQPLQITPSTNPIIIQDAKVDFPIRFTSHNIGQKTLSYVNDVFFSTNFDEQLEVIFHHRLGLKFLFGVKFRLEDKKNQTVIKMGQNNSEFSEYLHKIAPDDDNTVRLCSMGPDGTFRIEEKSRKDFIPALELETLYKHLFKDPNRSKIFLDVLCKKRRDYPDSENLFVLLPDKPELRNAPLLIETNEHGKELETTSADILFGNNNLHLVGFVFLAVSIDHVDFIKLLVNKKIITHDIDYSPDVLMQLASYMKSPTVLKYLLKYDCMEENYIHELYETPLYLAALDGNLEIVKILLASGENIDGNDEENHIRTPIMAAIQNGCHDIVNLLAENNAKLPSLTNYSDNDKITKSFYNQGTKFMLSLCNQMGTTLTERVIHTHKIQDVANIMNCMEDRLKKPQVTVTGNIDPRFFQPNQNGVNSSGVHKKTATNKNGRCKK